MGVHTILKQSLHTSSVCLQTIYRLCYTYNVRRIKCTVGKMCFKGKIIVNSDNGTIQQMVLN